MFLGKAVLKICSKFTGEHPCRGAILMALQHGCSLVNLLHIFRTLFSMDTYEGLLLFFRCFSHIFTMANELPGFSISRLANVKDFFNVNVFLNVNTNVNMNDYSFKYICLVCYLNVFIASPVLQC